VIKYLFLAALVAFVACCCVAPPWVNREMPGLWMFWVLGFYASGAFAVLFGLGWWGTR
jgi:hypothetical protein